MATTLRPTTARGACSKPSARSGVVCRARKEERPAASSTSLSAALVGGLAAVSIALSPGAALATRAPAPLAPANEVAALAAAQSIDDLREAGDVIGEVTSAEIPLLEEGLAKLAVAHPAEAEQVAAAERQLEAIESEAAQLAELEARDVPAADLTVATGGLLSQLSALKSAMLGL
eukprot:scaffold17.g439.t1